MSDKMVESYKALLEARAKIDAGNLSAEDQAFVDRALADSAEKLDSIQREAKAAQVAENIAAFEASVNVPQTKGFNMEEGDVLATPEYKDDFYRFLKTGERSDLITKAATWYEGSDSAGGAMVPKDFVAEIASVLFDAAPALGLARVIDVNTNSVDIPQITAHGASAAVVGEGVAVPDSNPTSARKTVTVFKTGASMKATAELVSDAPFLMEQVIAQELGGQVGALLNTDLTIGTGTGEPQGYVAGATTLFTVSATNTFTADELYSVKNALLSPYWRNSAWTMNQTTYKFIATLKDSNSRYLLGDLATGGGMNLIGHPLVLNPDVANYTTTAYKFISFGDHKKGHWVLRRPTLSVQRSDDRYFDTDEIAFKLTVRYGAGVVDAKAIAIGKTA
jgi:HK97 family phage major capsid protein